MRNSMGLFLAASAFAAGCAPGVVREGRPVAIEDLCGEIAEIVCDADERCCSGGGAMRECMDAQVERCDATLGSLVADPRVGYVPTRGGYLVRQIERRAGECWEEPFRFEELTQLFSGTGALGADCTPTPVGGVIGTSELLRAQLSCGGETTCRMHLDVRETARGVCEARDTSDAARCSHRYDCGPDEWCNLGATWEPGDWGDCQPLRTDGWACESDLECASGYCGMEGCSARPPSERCLTIAYPDVVMSSDPIAYFRLGESGRTAADAAGHHVGSYVAPVARVASGAIEDDDDGALSLSGMGGHVEVPALDGLASDGALTFELWVEKPMEGGGPLLELVSEDGAAIRVRLDGARIVASFLGAHDASATELATPDDAIGDGFRHVALTLDAVARLFVDGSEVASLEGRREIPVDASLAIGFHDDPDDALRTSLTGTVDELAIYDAALSSSTLGQHVMAGRTGRLQNDFVLFAWSR
jgi:hypothetical protein